MFQKYKLDEIKDIIDFARQTNRLSYLIRYNTTPHSYPESVSTHAYQVSIVSLFIYEKYKAVFKIDFEKYVKIFLVHDLPESMEYIGDIPHPIKKNNPELAKILEEAEYKAIKDLLGVDYVQYLKEYNEGETIEAKLVSLADVISCLIYSESEIAKGNRYMDRVKYESEERMIKILEELEYANK